MLIRGRFSLDLLLDSRLLILARFSFFTRATTVHAGTNGRGDDGSWAATRDSGDRGQRV
jgi:hypothetical protein